MDLVSLGVLATRHTELFNAELIKCKQKLHTLPAYVLLVLHFKRSLTFWRRLPWLQLQV